MSDEETLKSFMRLHPQHVCSILATYHSLKPSSIIESVEVQLWRDFLEIITSLDLLAAYETSDGFVIVKGSELIYLNRESWRRLLLGNFNVDVKKFSFNEWRKVIPLSDNGIDVHDVYIAKDVDTLLRLIRLHHIKRPVHERPRIERELGEILGYPGCCVANYVAKGAVRAWHDFHRELINMKMDQRMPIEFWAIYHVPCSPKCVRSLELGRKYLDTVKVFSMELYAKVFHDLNSSHLAFSVGRRFIDFKEVDSHVSPKVIAEVKRRLPTPRQVVVGEILRPFSYFTWSKGEYKLIVTPEIIGRKVIACSPGYGVLVVDEKLRVFIYVTKDLLSRESLKYASTAFRIYRTIGRGLSSS